MKLILGDSVDKLKELDDNSIDSIVTDPPYGLSFMGKKWDYDVPSQEIFEECLRVLKPGGHLLSFAGSRTYHRMAVRVEDAGFEIRDQIMWIYGSGFPKSHNIGKALDKNGGNGDLVHEVAEKLKQARESRGISKTQADKLFCNGSTNYSWLEGRKDGVRLPEDELFQTIVNEWPELKEYQEKVKSANREIVGKYDGHIGGFGGERLGNKGGDITLPSTPIAKQYEGWGTALKPAHEPIVMARKPLSERTVVNNVLEWGTGGINIDESRVGVDLNDPNHRNTKPSKSGDSSMFGIGGVNYGQNIKGRFPANIILDKEAGKILDEQSGINTSGKVKEDKNSYDGESNTGFLRGNSNSNNQHGDTGGASRFFYCPKTSKRDRNEGLEDFEDKEAPKRDDGQPYGMNTNKFRPDGSERKAVQPKKNNHPTVKPTDLMLYLIRLVTPKGGTTLDPFMGSGSTGKAAIRGGFDFVGIEREEEYMEIAEARIQYEIDNPYNEEKRERIKINKNKSNFW